MMRFAAAATATIVLTFSAIALAQDTQPSPAIDIAPGVSITEMGMMHIGPMNAEVFQFDDKWLIAEQHDIFKPDATSPATPQPGSHVISGTFVRPAPASPFHLTERLDSGVDGSVKFSATVTSDVEMPSNELSVAFSLPTSVYSGKQIILDKQPFTLPPDPAKKGEAALTASPSVQEIDLPSAAGTLVITGNINVAIQDDREWGDQRYAMRLHFSPDSGPIKESKIEFNLTWKPATAASAG
jgi:hypothetical protein